MPITLTGRLVGPDDTGLGPGWNVTVQPPDGDPDHPSVTTATDHAGAFSVEVPFAVSALDPLRSGLRLQVSDAQLRVRLDRTVPVELSSTSRAEDLTLIVPDASVEPDPMTSAQGRSGEDPRSAGPLEIRPADIELTLGERVVFALAGAMTDAGTPPEPTWSATDESGGVVPISPHGELTVRSLGRVTVHATCDGASARAEVTVLRFPARRSAATANSRTKNLSAADLETDDAPRWGNRNAGQATAVGNRLGHGETALAGTLTHPGRLGRRGQELREALTVGSDNYVLRVPVLHLPGRGLHVDLTLTYNARLWQVDGGWAEFDVDRGWPAPGWNLGFGRIVRLGEQGSVLVDADGTRHPFQTLSLSGDRQRQWHFTGRTSDGSFIDYEHTDDYSGGPQQAQARLPDGTIVEYTARAHPYREPNTTALHPGWGTMFPTRITDADGNFLTITYRDNVGPEIDTIVDTLGRTIRFEYGPDGRLTSVVAPGTGGSRRVAMTMTQVRMRLDLADAFPRLAVEARPDLRAPWVVRAIRLEDGTGYWFADPWTYSAYGMIHRVSQHRDLTLTTDDTGRPAIGAGAASRVRTYDYPLTVDPQRDDVPTYTSMTEWWDGMDGPPVTTRFAVQRDAFPRRVEVSYPSGARTVRLVQHHPGQYDDGTTIREELYDGTVLIQTTVQQWEPGDYGTARLARVQTEIPGGATTALEHSYGAFDRLLEVRELDFGAVTLLRRTRTAYHEGPEYVRRHILRLPSVTEVFARYETTPIARTEFRYDENALLDCPGVFGHSAVHDPYSPRVWVPPHTEQECDEDPRQGCITIHVPGYWVGEYDPQTRYRGHVTTIRRFAEPRALSGALEETRRYDIAGNLRQVVDGPFDRLTVDYEAASQYAYAIRLTRGDETSPADRVVTRRSHEVATGMPVTLVDADGQETTYGYDPQTFRLNEIRHPTGVVATIEVGSDAPTQIETLRDGDGRVLRQVEKLLDGLGTVRRHRILIEEANDTGPAHYVDQLARVDAMGRVYAVSRPHRAGDEPAWSTISYDVLDRIVLARGADGSETRAYYDEVQRPDDAPTPAGYGRTRRVVDPAGRQQWQLFSALGRLQILVTPDPGGDGAVFGAGSASIYVENDALDRVVSTIQRPFNQRREFRYDGIGRLTHLWLPERDATLNDAGTYHGPGAHWSDVYTWADRSRPATHTDPRGVTTRWDYGSDPLGRLRTLAYETASSSSRPGPAPVGASPVTFEYPRSGDVSRPRVVSTEDVRYEIDHDEFGRRAAETTTFLARQRLPLRLDYGFDALGRLTGITYPRAYGEDGTSRARVEVEFGVDGHHRRLSLDGIPLVSAAEHSPDGVLRYLEIQRAVGEPLVEANDVDPRSGQLVGQRVVAGADTLLDLTYELTDEAHASPTGQIYRVVDHLDPSATMRYAYDALGRVHSVAGGEEQTRSSWRQRYDYDRYGNLTVEADGMGPDGTRIVDGGTGLTFSQTGPSGFPRVRNRVLSPGFTYDEAGNLTRGRMADGRWLRFAYDAADRLVLVSGDDGTVLERCLYGFSRLQIGRIDEGAGRTTYWCRHRERTVAEYEETTTGMRWAGRRVFLGDRLLLSVNAGVGGGRGAATPEVLQHHPGRTGTRLVTGTRDVATRPVVILPYGALLMGTADGHPVVNTTYQRDLVTGLDDAVNRPYAPELGRFLQPDPVSALGIAVPDATGLNAYALCRGDPVNLIDPFGLRWIATTVWTSVNDEGWSSQTIWTWYPDEATVESDRATREDLARDRRDRGGQSGRSGMDVIVDMIGALSYTPSFWDTLGGLVAAVGVGAGALGTQSVSAVATSAWAGGAAGVGVGATAATGVAGAAMFGIGVGTVIDHYLTSVIGQSLGASLYDTYEQTMESYGVDMSWHGD